MTTTPTSIALLQPAQIATNARRPGTPRRSRNGAGAEYTYEELSARDTTSLDVHCSSTRCLTDLDNLADPEELAAEIIQNLEAGLNACVRY